MSAGHGARIRNSRRAEAWLLGERDRWVGDGKPLCLRSTANALRTQLETLSVPGGPGYRGFGAKLMTSPINLDRRTTTHMPSNTDG